MKNGWKQLVIATCITLLLVTGATAMTTDKTMTEQEARTLVQPFYDFLGGKGSKDKVRPAFSPDWISFWGNGATDFRTLDQTLGFFGGPLREMIPDLGWQIKDVMVTTDNQIVVRGEGSGTPAGGNLFGHPAADGKSFKVMSIDIHTVQDGKIVKSYHIEDWFTGISQLSTGE